jgi:hypothetical protein
MNSVLQPHNHTDSTRSTRWQSPTALLSVAKIQPVSANDPTHVIFVLSYSRAPANQFIDIINKMLLLFTMAQQPLMHQRLLIIEDTRSQSDTLHSVGFLWTSDQPDAETTTWQHTIFTSDRPPCLRRDSNPQHSHFRQTNPLKPISYFPTLGRRQINLFM